MQKRLSELDGEADRVNSPAQAERILLECEQLSALFEDPPGTLDRKEALHFFRRNENLIKKLLVRFRTTFLPDIMDIQALSQASVAERSDRKKVLIEKYPHCLRTTHHPHLYLLLLSILKSEPNNIPKIEETAKHEGQHFAIYLQQPSSPNFIAGNQNDLKFAALLFRNGQNVSLVPSLHADLSALTPQERMNIYSAPDTLSKSDQRAIQELLGA
jgi:hypothetical protein